MTHKIVISTMVAVLVAGCDGLWLDTYWRSEKYVLVAVDARGQMNLSFDLGNGTSVGLVGPTVFSVGADDKHIVVKQHPSRDPFGSSVRPLHHALLRRRKDDQCCDCGTSEGCSWTTYPEGIRRADNSAITTTVQQDLRGSRIAWGLTGRWSGPASTRRSQAMAPAPAAQRQRVRWHPPMASRDAFAEVASYIAELSAGLQKSSIDSLRSLVDSPKTESKQISGIVFEVMSWARPHLAEDKLGVVVEARRQRFLGWSQVTARGFFVDNAGVHEMREEDYWDYGY